MERTPAYLRGRSDFEADVEHILNPYPPMSCEWHEWDSDGATARTPTMADSILLMRRADMLPTLWQIVEDLASGSITRRQAFAMLKAHIRAAARRR